MIFRKIIHFELHNPKTKKKPVGRRKTSPRRFSRFETLNKFSCRTFSENVFVKSE